LTDRLFTHKSIYRENQHASNGDNYGEKNMNLYEATKQWASRPSDQRFWTLEDLLRATINHRKAATVGTAYLNDLSVEPEDQQIMIVGKSGLKARMNSWAFAQLCSRFGVPASYLRTLPTDLACKNLQHGMSYASDRSVAKVLLDQSNGLTARAILSEQYSRIWNFDLVGRLLDLPKEWRVPPARPAHANDPNARPATKTDLLDDNLGQLSIHEGDMIAPAGLYASAEDLFVFMINEQNRINDGSQDGLSRGFFLSNSEVGKASFKLTTYYYRHVCGNHIVWSASNVKELRLRHIGTADKRFHHEMQIELRKYSNASVSDEEAKIKHVRQYRLAVGKDKVIDLIFQRGILSRKKAEEAYDTAERSGEIPDTAWGYTQGITEMSQALPNADLRVELDRAAGRVLEMAF
jgi:hypothetical protein